jgi:hypothetical protein
MPCLIGSLVTVEVWQNGYVNGLCAWICVQSGSLRCGISMARVAARKAGSEDTSMLDLLYQ